MSQTTAVPAEVLRKASMSVTTGKTLCPQCRVGYLDPFLVEIGLSVDGQPWQGADYLVGWVAVCGGNADEVAARNALYDANGDVPEDEVYVSLPCGFSLPMQAKRLARAAMVAGA